MELTPQLARFISPLSTAITLTASNPPGQRFIPARHLRYISNKITQGIYEGGAREMFSAPPRHGKSFLIDHYTPIWYLERFPHKKIILAGYGKTFATDFGRIVRNLVNEHADKLSFRLAEDSQKKEEWHTEQGGGMMCVGVGSGVTGRGADLLIIDDPIKGWDEASSWTTREAMWNWYTSEARSRLHPGGSIITVMTRWNQDDLLGRLEAQARCKATADQWDITNLPAIYDAKAAEQGPCPLGRKIGEALWPERFPISELLPMQANDVVWESLYQGRPGTVANLGNVYQFFDVTKHVVKNVSYDPFLPFFWALDFNIDPMCTVYGQYRKDTGLRSALTGRGVGQTRFLGELCLNETSTREVCEAFYERYRQTVRGDTKEIEIYGDATGDNKHTSQTSGTDYDIVKQFLREKGVKYKMCVQPKNPPIKDRVNAVNDVCFAEQGLLIHPSCKMLIRDLDNVRYKRDTNGNSTGALDKSQKDLTHISDAAGYFVWKKFGARQGFGEQGFLIQ